MSNIADYGITAGAAAQSAASPHGAAEGWAPSSVNNWAREYMAAVNRWYRDQDGSLSVGGTSAAFTLSTNESFAGSAIASYSTMPILVARTSVKCVANPTINIDGLGARALVKNGGVALVDGDLTASQVVAFVYNHTRSAVEVISPLNKPLNLQDNNIWTGTNEYSATASFKSEVSIDGVLTAPLITNSVIADAKGLVVVYVTAATVDIDATNVLLENSNGKIYKATTVNLTVNITTAGANGLDTGAEAANTWYYLYVIYNGTTVAGLISASATAPTMPSGYTYKGLVGAVRNDGSSNFINFRQTNKIAVLNVPIQNAAVTDAGTAAVLATLTCPPTAVSDIIFRGSIGSATTHWIVTETTQADTVPAAGNQTMINTAGADQTSTSLRKRADSSSQIRVRTDNTTGDYEIYTYGWIWE